MNRLLAFLLVGLSTLAPLGAQDFARELDEASALYREGRFGQTIARLQTLILRLQNDGKSLSPTIEAEAHLLTALAYVALDDRDAAKSSFWHLLRLAPERTLDPEVYAPKVVALFEEAKRSLPAEREPVGPPASTSATTSSAPPSADSRSRLPWVFVGGAAGAGAAAAIAQIPDGSAGTLTTTSAPPSVEIDARMNGLKEGSFSCSQGLFLTIDVINRSANLVGVDGFDLTLNTISAECGTHRPAIDGTVGMDVLPGARVQIRRADLAGDLCGSPGGVPGCGWRAVVVVVTNRGAFEDQIVFNTIP